MWPQYIVPRQCQWHKTIFIITAMHFRVGAKNCNELVGYKGIICDVFQIITRVISLFPHAPKSILTNPSFFEMHNTVYGVDVYWGWLLVNWAKLEGLSRLLWGSEGKRKLPLLLLFNIFSPFQTLTIVFIIRFLLFIFLRLLFILYNKNNLKYNNKKKYFLSLVQDSMLCKYDVYILYIICIVSYRCRQVEVLDCKFHQNPPPTGNTPPGKSPPSPRPLIKGDSESLRSQNTWYLSSLLSPSFSSKHDE